MIDLTAVRTTEGDVRAVADCYASGWLTMGPRTTQLEAAFAAATGADHAVALSSGTAALHLALQAAGVGPGDDVLLPALAHPAVDGLVRRLGATPVACDVVGPLDHGIDPADVARRLTPATRAVVVDHRWGYPVALPPLAALLRGRGMALIEDAAHAVLAAGVGGGDLTCWSLSATKQLVAGEGGVVTTPHAHHADRVRSLRSHAMTSVTWDRHRGHAESYDVVEVGFNYRIDEPRAALALHRLPRLADALAHRRARVRDYRLRLGALDGVLVPYDEEAVARGTHGAFGVLFADRGARDAVATALTAARIASTPLDADGDVDPRALPHASAVRERGLRLPLHEVLGPEDVERVCSVVAGAVAG